MRKGEPANSHFRPLSICEILGLLDLVFEL